MKKHPAFTYLLVAVAGLVLVSQAKAQGYEVTIPKSRIEMPKTPEPETPHAPDQLDFGASSWAPSGFSLPSRVAQSTTFARAGLPSVYFNYLKSLESMTDLDGLYLKTGLNWLSLSRDGKIGSESAAVLESQSVSLLSVRIGAEYAPTTLQIAAAQPYLGLALLPSFGMTGRTAFDDGTAYFGVPIEYALGAQFDLHRFGVSLNQAHLDIGMTGTAGTVDHSSVAGIGIKGGIRVAL